MRVLNRITSRVNEIYPVAEEETAIYRGVSVGWALGAAAMAEATAHSVETGQPIVALRTAAGAVATLLALGGSIFFNDRARQSSQTEQ